jgi:hypothetical protein
MPEQCRTLSPTTWWAKGKPVRPQCCLEEGHEGLHRTSKSQGNYLFPGGVKLADSPTKEE